MKKLILSTILFCFLATSYVFAQSVTIVPGASPTPGIKLSNVLANRRIVLWEDVNNDHQFYGLGINGNTLRYQVSNTGASHIFYVGANATTSNELMRITGTGQVGIGTSSFGTGEKFAVRNGIMQFGIFPGYLDSTPDGEWTTIDMNATRGLRVWDNFSVSGTVGIGTTAPATTLDVRGSAAAITVGTAGAGGGALYLGNTNHGIQRGFPTYNADNNVGLYTTAGNLYLAANGKVTNQFVLTTDGKVGIGTTSPSEKLEVVGQMKINNNLRGLEHTNGTQSVGTYVDVTAGWLGTFSNHPLFLFTNDGEASMTVATSGRVGIGTTNPDSPLHVTGAGFTTPSLVKSFFNVISGLVTNNVPTSDIKVHADGYFWADGGGFVATSDARIKNILGRTNNGDDLEKLRKIAVTDYKYIDEVSNGSTLQKKVIAQQVKEIFPIAINQTKGIIPNVYQVAKQTTIVGNTTQIVTTKAHDFATGDVVKLIVENAGEKIVDVTVIDSHTFSVNRAFNDKVFVYGKQVNDLHNVDYDAISMLNVSATQELAKQVDALKRKNEELEAKVAEMDELKAQMASLRSLMLKTDNEKEAVRVSENRK